MNHAVKIPAAALLILFAAGCDRAERPAAARRGKPRVAAVHYPLAYFAQRLGGDAFEVLAPFPADGDPAFWHPAPEQIAVYQGADAILLNGADYAKWTSKAALPDSKLVNTSAAFKAKYIATEGTRHKHGPEGEHDHGGTAFTTWIDFDQAAQQARAVADALIRLKPAAKASVDAAFETLRGELLDLDRELKAIGAKAANKPLVASHPVYQYVARRYGLNLKAVQWEPETPPSEAQWKQFEQLLEAHPAQWMIWEGEPLPTSVGRLKKLGVRSVVFDPCGNRPESGDFLSVMRENLKNLKAAWGD